jgi:hypothetical protein
VLTEMNVHSYSSRGSRMERLDVTTGERVTVPRLGDAASSASVSDDGVVVVATGDRVLTWPPVTGRPNRRGVEDWRPAAVVPGGSSAWERDGGRLAIGSTYEAVAGLAVGSPEHRRLRVVGSGAPAAFEVLGWVGDRHVAALRHDAGEWDHVDTVLVDVSTGRVATVGEVEIGVPLGQLTVATGLMTPSRPTVGFQPPEWTRPSPWWWVGGATLLVAVGAAAWLVVRRRSLRR